jgi:hypothetical protein
MSPVCIFPGGQNTMPFAVHHSRVTPVGTGGRLHRVMGGSMAMLLLWARLASAQGTGARPTPAQRDSLRAISQDARRLARNRTAPDIITRRQRA